MPAYSIMPVLQVLELGLVLFWRGKEGRGCFLGVRLQNVFEMLLIIYLKLAWAGDLQFSSVAPLLIAASGGEDQMGWKQTQLALSSLIPARASDKVLFC